MTGRTITVVFGVVVAMVGVVLIFGAAGPLSEYRDADGYYMGDPFPFDRPSHAIVTGDIELLQGRYPDLASDSLLLFVMADPVEVRMQGVASGPDSLFMGIAATPAVAAYLNGAVHDEVTGVERHQESHQIQDVAYTTHQGTDTPGVPGAESFWVASVAGTGVQTLDWTIESGDWTAVIMNDDASSGVTADVAFGAAPPSNIDPIAWTMMTAGFIALLGGGGLVFVGLRHRDRTTTSASDDSPDEQATADTESYEKKPTTTR